jgi:two-component system LytT family sensor kinase
MLNQLLKSISLYRLHILSWSLYILYEVTMVELISGITGSLSTYVVHYIFNIVLFYVHAHLVLPVVFRKTAQVFWKLPLAIAGEIVIYFITLYLIDYLLLTYLHMMVEISLKLSKIFFVRVIYRSLYFIGFSTGYYFLITFIQERGLNEQLEKQKLNDIIEQQKVKNELNLAVNAYLKAQINPHFLFNTLNYIYNNIRKIAPNAAEAILTLSDMMRYAIKSEDPEGFVLLSEEVEQLKNLILLHQLRQEDTLYLTLDYSSGKYQASFVPLVLLTLAENMFKHGNLSKASRPASIVIHCTEAGLEIITANLINEGKDDTGTRLGLENIKQRLFHTYGSAAGIEYYTDTENYFQVKVYLKNNRQLYPL